MRTKFIICLLCLGWLLPACAPEPPVATAIPSRTLAPPSPTTEFRLVASWTPTASPPPSATPTPRPTATPNLTLRPYLTAQPNYTPLSGQGISTPDPLASLPWLDRLSFATEQQPFLLFDLRYDPAAWQLESILTPAGLGYQLAHRLISGCVLSQTTGGNATEDMSVEYTDEVLGDTAYYIGEASQEGELVFVTYCTSYADTPTCFIAYPGTAERRCLAEVEGMLSGISFITNPRYSTAPHLWACRDEQNNPGLCQISYSLRLNALSFPGETDGWAAGEQGLLLHWDGLDWEAANSPADATLYALDFVAPDDGWAAGDGGLILHWDGQDWTVNVPYTDPEDVVSGAAQAIYALDFYQSDVGWAAGATAYPDGRVEPLLLHWNGRRWQPVVDLPDCQPCGLNAVLALHSQDVWIAGGGMLAAEGEGAPAVEVALIWHWDGSTWTSFPARGATRLYALAQDETGGLWAAGIEQALTASGASVARGAVLGWDGSGWEPLSLPPQSGGIYALSSLPGGALVTGGEASLLRFSRTWSYVATEIAAYGWITALEATPGGTLYALTSSGFLFRMTP
jgi:hypothetical protein